MSKKRIMLLFSRTVLSLELDSLQLYATFFKTMFFELKYIQSSKLQYLLTFKVLGNFVPEWLRLNCSFSKRLERKKIENWAFGGLVLLRCILLQSDRQRNGFFRPKTQLKSPVILIKTQVPKCYMKLAYLELIHWISRAVPQIF